MKPTIQIAIRRGERKYIAGCLEFPIVTEASLLDELVRNIEQSVALFLNDEDLSELGLAALRAMTPALGVPRLASVAITS